MKQSGNILLVSNYASDVGYAWWLMENFWVQISEHFDASGRECVLTYPEINTIPDDIRNSNIKVVQHDFNDRSPAGLLRLSSIIKQHNISSLYLTDQPYYGLFYFFIRRFGVKRIVLHDHKPGERPSVRGVRRLVKGLIYFTKQFSCDSYIGVSEFVHHRLIDSTCIPQNRCTYVHNGIRLYEKREEYKTYVNKYFDIPENATVVVSTGRATFYKGIDLLIKAAEILINKDGEEELYFLHCGDGPDMDRFKDMVNQFGLQGRFIFAGRRNDVPKILQSCDIGVQASKGEAFSLSILEYLYAGLIVIVPKSCGNVEAVVDGENGYLYQTGNTNELVQKIRAVLQGKEINKRISEEAVKTVVNKFTLDKMNSDFVNCIKDRL